MPTAVPASEFTKRLEAVRNRIAEADATAGVWFSATSIEYLSGFAHIQTERPVVLAVTQDRLEITVPRLEVERVEPNPRIDAVHHYRDYPGGDPIGVVVEMLDGLDAGSVAADAEGAPGVMGFEGPSLATAWEAADGTSGELDVSTQSWVDRMRWCKSDLEVDLVRESARWANLAHRYLTDYTEVGAHPATVSQRASMDGSRAMLDALGSEYVPRTRGTGPVHAGYITGEQTALPHGHTANRRLEPGDVAITGASANVDGYHSELERTMFLGEPDDEQRHYFELATEAQKLAIDALGPGVEIAYVDEVVESYFEEQGVQELARHHVGHNIGMDGHEPPYIDRGWTAHCEHEATGSDADDETMKPGMIWTIEPGLYTESEGYRHSDTVAITEDGTDRLTTFPRSIEGNTIRVE
ncbi:M24 family metallopeptidase [Salinarchaeum laminariae]|uniref:M24 family metallopeptidase n=1 Tax=Salinarchaeum laminariae TaxID=869888 RepID=UPI0020BD5A89|nr:Xaa-Pro peptidase family protein [Salinarchaeum laminariae]